MSYFGILKGAGVMEKVEVEVGIKKYITSHNELLEKQLKTIIMSITIAINNMFQPFKWNISFILYNNSAKLNILFKMKIV